MIGPMSPVPHPPSPALSCDALMGDVVRLEPLTPGHVPGLRRAAEGAGPSAFAAVPTPDEVEDYVVRSLARRDAGAYAPFAQVEAATGRVVGHTAYLTPRWMDGGRLFAVEIGSTWLAPAARGTAVNPAAKLLLMTQAFESWGVDRVDIKTDARNEAARAARSRPRGRPSRRSCAPGSPPWRPARRGSCATRPCSASPLRSGPGSGSAWRSASSGAARRGGDER